MAQQFEYDMKLKQAELENQKAKEKEIEDRKDERTKIQATQQSELIDQRKTIYYQKTLNPQVMMQWADLV